MKKGIHPNYRPVVFQDAAANFAFLTRSCVETDETIKWTDGKEYPLYKLEISSASHPFFTGKMKLVDTTGRVQKFQDKYKNSKYGAKKDGEAKPTETAKPAEGAKGAPKGEKK
jgi:large subunit ribosomal protein L31